jgi:hypothetical protein
MSDQTTNVKGEYLNGDLVYTLGNGATVIFKDYTGATIFTIGQTEINANVTFKAPTVSTEGA